MVRYPTITTPVISHAEHSINEVGIVIGHQFGGVLDTIVNGEHEVFSLIFITKSFQIAKEYTHLDIQ